MRIFFALLLLASSAVAQYATNLTLPKNNFLQGEPLVATLTITNRSGADVIVGGKGSRPWIQFQFEDGQGRQLSPVQIGSAEPFTLKAGGTTKHTVQIEGQSSTGQLGTFYTTAHIFHPISGQYYATARARVNVTDAKPMFDDGFGVPAGFPQAGRARRYHAIVFRDIDSISLYARVVDDRTKEPLVTQPLGPIITSIQPRIQIDAKNFLHLLFVVQPTLFCHTVVKPDGSIAKREYYRDRDGSRPTLVMTGTGAEIVGGENFDPAKAPKTKGFRKTSERPKE
ncbi:MAG: hypothetical protein JNN17_23605 [Verrucomicrobiaceae bacterium]|nr:hypothetical protein [Verrucomicrobiaceae bacterium]